MNMIKILKTNNKYKKEMMDDGGGEIKKDFDLVNVINTVLPFEKHLPGMNYCGPGTNLKKKLNSDFTVKEDRFKPVDRVDKAAMCHDIKYNKYNDLRNRHRADKEMMFELVNIQNPTWRERVERIIVLTIIGLKSLVESFILWILKK